MGKRKFYGNEVTKAISEIHDLLKECVNFDNIESAEFVRGNIEKIEKYKDILPEELFSEVQVFIKDVIEPIAEEPDYFDFLHQDEIGKYNQSGAFEINSEKSLKLMMVLFIKHIMELEKEVDDFVLMNLYKKLN